MAREHDQRTAQQDAQRELYGETWEVRLTRLRETYRVSQGRLAAVVGLSAPMVSQLVSGQRVKITNPVVYARIVRLEERACDPGVASGEAAVLARVLDEVAAASPVLTTQTLVTGELVPGVEDAPSSSVPTTAQSTLGGDRAVAVGWLATAAPGAVLADLAALAGDAGAAELAGALAEAASRR